ncbi:putative uncharacterized protein [Burkholderiales bacterium GJ-E10]|nr:putative uncharacterized protein [Burkholderiales bacterium GJ-E10]
MRKIAAALVAALVPVAAWSADLGGVEHQGAYGVVHPISDARPNAALTPGAVDPRVTQDNIRATICARGYTRTVRPTVRYTSHLKRRQIVEYGYTDRRLRDYEEDHLIPLEIGGNPTDPRNLWPEPRHVIGGWGAKRKDKLENALHRLVCRGRIPLAQAQREIAQNWIAAYQRYVGE